MSTPLLETKLFVPRPREGLVARPRLSDRLDRGAAWTLMLVSAPAGFGKTTLVAEWLAVRRAGSSAAWLSLDGGDNDPTTYWTYVIAALQTVVPGVGVTAVDLLQAAPPPRLETVLTTLLNDLNALAEDTLLVLDDFHVIDSREVQEAMVFFLEHLPPRLRLVIASRADPALPLSRLRARGDLIEVRAADLRFTPDEATAYLNGVMDLQLTAADVTALEGRTEGWVAALQLAALSMQGRDDAHGFIAGFTGDDRYVVDYLVEEVIQRQSEHVRSFLLRTSVLDRLSGSLCDAVTGHDDGRAMLEGLERANLFLVPLDDHRHWYRYHHLFADVLHARLLHEQPDDVAGLHERASAWYEQHDEMTVAIRHAFAADDYERAATLVERALRAARRDRQDALWVGWMTQLPDEVVRRRPVLCNAYAGGLLSTGELTPGRAEGVESWLRHAERWLDAPEGSPTQMVVVDEAEFGRLPAWVAIHRAGLALVTDDPASTVAHGQRALDLLEDDDHMGHGAATALMGLAAWRSGDLEAVHAAYAAGMVRFRRAGFIADMLGLSITLADVRIAQGRLRDARRTYEDALTLNSEHGRPVLRGTADMHVGLSVLHREWNDLPAAAQHLQASQDLGEHNGLEQNPYRWRVSQARIREAEGDLEAAVAFLDDAERVYVGDFSPEVRPIPAMRARVWLAQGRLDEVVDWARHRDLADDDELHYLREYEHLTLVRLLMARFGIKAEDRFLAEASALLTRLLRAAEEGGRGGSVIEILVLQAVAHQLRGDLERALVPLTRALELAEPEGYVRIFVDEGPVLAALLDAAAERGIAPGYARRLAKAGASRPDRSAAAQGLVDPLSEREREVLRLLGTELSGPEIARELVVSLNTVRTHTKSIYTKLGVTNRRAAVRRGEELDLLR
jgi:LuxR family maltose regulon positive regulatory protein